MVAVARLVLIGFLASGLLATIVGGSQSSQFLFSVDGALCIHSLGSGNR
jgi:hypothetical protein